ncbi:hypothetical protein CY0110_16492 [Crocosphaera chwakensis CCY0110]|uniref:Uncharacterized protein n=1 Tax=Crocosphaera chwakensis CCY0110 TaxID=391612 RepID=A3IHY0_9CHRO|nr:hypothetical protein CY0110_16492 [Crocosphaera chwakensis CCY0110]
MNDTTGPVFFAKIRKIFRGRIISLFGFFFSV